MEQDDDDTGYRIRSRKKIYSDVDVLTATNDRLRYMFDHFDNVCFAVSGGKDSGLLVQLANAIAAEVQMLAWRFRDAHRKVGLYRDTLVPKGLEALKTTQKAFEAGKASFADFIDAQRMLLEFQLSYERALADREQRLAELEALIGRPIPRPVAGPAERK